MRFLHTADVHLKRGEEERLAVFRWMLKRADELKVDYFIVAGDLFDSDADATLLRPQIREVCESSRASFLFLPGNHDVRAFGPEYEYGGNVIQITAEPFQVLQCKDIKICGMPYTDKRFSDCTKDMPHDIGPPLMRKLVTLMIKNKIVAPDGYFSLPEIEVIKKVAEGKL